MGEQRSRPRGNHDGKASDLGPALTSLGTRLSYPEPPAIAAGVRDRLEREEGYRRGGVPTGAGAWWRPALVAAAAILILAVIALRLVPGVREAVADHLGLPGVVIRLLGDAEPAVPPAVGENLMLGERVSVAQASDQVDIELALPTVDGLGRPDIYVLTFPNGIMTTAVYPPGPGFPDTTYPGVGALLSQFKGSVAGPMIQKSLIRDGEEPGASLEVFSLNGNEAYWIEGPAHAFFYTDQRGEVQTDTFRLAQNVLLWQRGTTIFRLESAMTKAQAIAIAGSLQPVLRSAGNLRA